MCVARPVTPVTDRRRPVTNTKDTMIAATVPTTLSVSERFLALFS